MGIKTFLNAYSQLFSRYIEDIYFFGVNSKYISSSAVKKQYFSRVEMLIFSPNETRSVISDKHPSCIFFLKIVPVPQLPRKPCFATVKI